MVIIIHKLPVGSFTFPQCLPGTELLNLSGTPYLFTPEGVRWLASRQERLDLLRTLDEMNSPTREAMVMKVEQLRSKITQIADYCLRTYVNPQL
jgi:hypothetical protein